MEFTKMRSLYKTEDIYAKQSKDDSAQNKGIGSIYVLGQCISIPQGNPLGIGATASLTPAQTQSIDSLDYVGNFIYEKGQLKRYMFDDGYLKLYTNTFSPRFFIRDHLGNNRIVTDGSGNIQQNTNYYPYGGMTHISTNQGEQQFKYNGKEYDPMHGLNEYDYGARQYDPAIGKFTTMDPLCEKYYHISPYAYCSGNPVNAVDPDGKDWYKSNTTGYYYWADGNYDNDNFTYIGKAGALLGEYEEYIDKILTKKFEQKGLYTPGLCLDIAALDKGVLMPSKERGWDILDEFIMGVGPVISIFTSQHEYTKELMNIELANEGYQAILNGATEFSKSYDFGVWDLLTTPSLIKQFIGSYNYYGELSKNKKFIYNIIADGKSLSSLMYHLTPQSWNQSRDTRKSFSNTYQFYIWQTKIK